MRSSASPATFFQSAKASSSSVKTVAMSRPGVEPEVLGEELPGEGDRVLLEVVAEGEVAEHLEERVVAGGEADVLEVVVLAAGAHALLGGGGAHVVAALLAQEDVLELHHAGVGEEQGRIAARHERTRTAPGCARCARSSREKLRGSRCRSWEGHSTIRPSVVPARPRQGLAHDLGDDGPRKAATQQVVTQPGAGLVGRHAGQCGESTAGDAARLLELIARGPAERRRLRSGGSRRPGRAARPAAGRRRSREARAW